MKNIKFKKTMLGTFEYSFKNRGIPLVLVVAQQTEEGEPGYKKWLAGIHTDGAEAEGVFASVDGMFDSRSEAEHACVQRFKDLRLSFMGLSEGV